MIDDATLERGCRAALLHLTDEPNEFVDAHHHRMRDLVRAILTAAIHVPPTCEENGEKLTGPAITREELVEIIQRSIPIGQRPLTCDFEAAAIAILALKEDQ